MDLDVGCGGGEFETKPRAEICIDVDLPHIRLDNFVMADIQHLPFRSQSFKTAYCANVLEHIQDPIRGVNELARVSSHQVIIQDKLWSLGSYSESSHLWFQLPHLKFLKYPRTQVGIAFANLLKRFWKLKLRWGKDRVFSFYKLLVRASPRYTVETIQCEGCHRLIPVEGWNAHAEWCDLYQT